MRDTASATERDINWTERQRQVLDLLARGKTNPEIAEALDVSLAGAKWHVSEVISKLGVTSREEAAAWWQQQRSRRRQVTRTLRGLVAMPLARIAGATAGVAAVGAGIAFVALPLAASDGDEPQAQDVQATPVPRLSVYSDDEVDWLAKSHAHDLVLTPYSVTTDNGRHLTAVDFVVLERVFQPGALSVESNIIGETRALERPMDVWTVRLALRPPEHAGKYSESRALVTFEDGTGILLGGGDVGALPFEGKAVEAARVVVNGAEFRTYVGFEEIHSSPLRALTGPLACIYDFDVRMPNWFGGGCDSATDGPRFSGALHAGTSHRQGYAHAKGFVTDEVARIRLVTEDGREVFVEPAGRATIDGRPFPWRGFMVAAPGPEWFVTVEALDAAGNVIGAVDTSNHPGRFAQNPRGVGPHLQSSRSRYHRSMTLRQPVALDAEHLPALVPIPGGEFVMGKDGSRKDEGPAHRVVVAPFRAAVSPVTNAQWMAYVAAADQEPPPFIQDERHGSPELPVVGINWFEAVAYCEWLAARTGVPFRLPTEAEREFAALGGLPGGDWPWEGDRHPIADWIDALDGPHAPREECANGYGLRCMAENVHEWCSDWYDAAYYAASPMESPRGPAEAKRRASRGGSWRHREKVTRINARSSIPPEFHYADYGFRVYADA